MVYLEQQEVSPKVSDPIRYHLYKNIYGINFSVSRPDMLMTGSLNLSKNNSRYFADKKTLVNLRRLPLLSAISKASS